MSSALAPQKPLQAFLHFLEKEKRGSVHTLRCYRSDLNQFQRFLNDNMTTKNWWELMVIGSALGSFT